MTHKKIWFDFDSFIRRKTGLRLKVVSGEITVRSYDNVLSIYVNKRYKLPYFSRNSVFHALKLLEYKTFIEKGATVTSFHIGWGDAECKTVSVCAVIF